MSSRQYPHGRNQRPYRRPRSLTSTVFQISTTAALAYGTYQAATWAWNYFSSDDQNANEAQEESQSTSSSMTRKQKQLSPMERTRRIHKCREETLTALVNFLPTLQSCINELNDVSKITKALKQIRHDKKKSLTNSNLMLHLEREEISLWQDMKMRSLMQFISFLYGHCMLFLVLTVQVHLLGRRLYESFSVNLKESNSSSSSSSHAIVLQSTYTYMFESGLHTISQSLSSWFHSQSQNHNSTFSNQCWNMMDPHGITKSQFRKGIMEIRSFMEHTDDINSHHNNRPLWLSMAVQSSPPSSLNDNNYHDLEAKYILDQTWDILESPLFQSCLQQCVQTTLDHLLSQYIDPLFLEERLPLVKIITKLKTIPTNFIPSPSLSLEPYPFGEILQNLESVLDLGDLAFAF